MTQISNRLTLSPRQALGRCAPLDGLLETGLFKALGDKTRVQLLGCLAKCGRACSVGEMAECCAVDLSVVSRHLAVLREAGVITCEKRGKEVWCTVQTGEVAQILRDLADALDACCPADPTDERTTR